MDFGIWQIAIVLVIALLVFGPKRLPELGRSLGSGMREFKGSIGDIKSDEETSGQPKLEASVTEVSPAERARGAEPFEGEVVETRN